MSKFICSVCNKEKDSYPRTVTKDNKYICWQCSALDDFNKRENELFNNLKKEIKDYMLESPNSPNSVIIYALEDLLNFIKNRNHIENFNNKLKHLIEELEILNNQ